MMRSTRHLGAAFVLVGVLTWACGGDESPAGPSSNSDAAASSGSFASSGAGSSNGGEAGPTDPPPNDDPGTPVYPTAHPRILLSNAALRQRLTAALAVGEPAAVRFRERVDLHQRDGNVYAYKPWFSALLYVLTAQEEYGAFAVEAADALVASEEALLAGGERASVAGDNYLEVGDRVGGLMLVYDWCYDRLTAEQRTRWLAYANQAVWNVWHHEQAAWNGTAYPWNGWSVDNPGNNYYYSFLEATMFLGLASRGENDQADGFIDTFRNQKIGAQAVPKFRDVVLGGGSQEGTGYGVALARLFKLYAFWEYTTTERIARLTQHPRASMLHMAHTVVPTLDFVTPTGDHARDSSAALFDYHRDYLQILATLYDGERMAKVSRGLLAASSVPEMEQGFMFYSDFLFGGGTAPATEPPAVLATAFHGPGTGQIMTRSSWNADATYLNILCGPYTESHAHRDQGSFVLYRGAWLASDSQLLSHSGIEQAEEMHNLVRVTHDGPTVRQRADHACQVVSLADQPSFTYVHANVTPLYEGQSEVEKMERETVFLKPDTVVVFDRAVVTAGAQTVWQLNSITRPTLTGSTLSVDNAGNRLDVFRIAPANATVDILDWTTLPAEGAMNGGFRTDVTGADGVFLHVLGTAGAVTQAVAADAAGETGVQITFQDGRSATVRFSTAARGGWLRYEIAGQTVHDGALPSGVATLPPFVN